MLRRSLLALLALLLAAACAPDAGRRAPPADSASAPAAGPVTATDDGGRTVRLDGPARRVVSLIPNATDVAVALGASAQLVGRTRYDVRPDLAHLPSVGGGLDPSLEALLALRPDLVVTWDHDERADTRRRLEAAGVHTFGLRSEDTTDVLAAVARLGTLLGRDSAAAALAAAIRADVDAVRRSVAGRPPRRVFFAVGTAPPMTAGPATFVGQLLAIAGARSVFDDVAQLWPTVAIEEVVRRQPDVVVLPAPADDAAARVAALRTMPGWRELRAVQEGRVVTIDPDVVYRPGATMGTAARTLRDLLHPEVADATGARP